MRSSSRAVLALVVVAIAAGAVVVATIGDGDAGPGAALDAYLEAWSRGDDRAAARDTDRPRDALATLGASRAGLDGASVRARTVALDERDDAATARVRVSWAVPRFGSFAYETRLALARQEDRWVVRWRPAAVHPRLGANTRLGTVLERADRGDVVDRDGVPLVTERAVMDVAVRVDRVRDPQDTARRLGTLLDVDAGRLARAVRRAGKGRFIPVITLRLEDFRAVEERLQDVPGISLAAGRRPLAPTRTFAHAALGSVGPVTAEQLERLGRGYRTGDEVGQSGLQSAYERRLRGTPTAEVVIRSREDGELRASLARRPGRPGRSLRTTLDRDVQRAGEAALAGRDSGAALVALQPSSGDVLAVVNRPAGSALNRAFTGLYPPGSTFKVVSTAALLRAGLDTAATVDCPRTLTIDGKPFRNFEGDARGPVPFSVDFAQSCNTAFVSLADRLSADALTDTARGYGLGQRLGPGLPAAEAKVPAARDRVRRAAMMIGQDRIVASPLAMAGVAGAVADGRWRAPRLLRSDPRRAGERLPAGEVATLRRLMRSVVDSGTGTALSGVAGDVAGKSGTAEYGGGDPPPTHAWFVAFRGDLAVSVLVEGGRSGGAVAAPLAGRFFAALDGDGGG